MKKTRFQRVICFILSVAMLLSVGGVTVFASSDDSGSLKRPENGPAEKNPYSASTLEEMQALVGTLPYTEYLNSYSEQRDAFIANLANGHEYHEIVVGPTADANGNPIAPEDRILYFNTDPDIEANSGKIAQPVLVKGENGEEKWNQACKDSIDSKYDPLSGLSWGNFGEENYDKSVYLPAQGYASWQVTLTSEQEGFYYIQIEYYSVETAESSISAIERKFKIDGKVPFEEVSTLKFDRNWAYKYGNIADVVTDAPGEPDSYDVKYEIRENEGEQGYYKVVTQVKDGKKTVKTYRIMQDINDNSMAPEASREASWHTYRVSDSSGYYDGSFEFYFAEGTRTITLEAEREPMIIKSIRLIPVTDPVTLKTVDGDVQIEQTSLPSYEDILKKYQELGYYNVAEGGKIIEIQAEFPDLVSDSSVAATNDNTSAITYPVSPNSQLYNVIGENSYSAVGQWAAYKFTVTKTGLYNLAMRFKQDALQGMYICRTIKIHGGNLYKYGEDDGTPEVPFAEAYQAEFNYSKKWQSTFVSKDEVPFMFFFEEGVEYTVYFECSLGTLKEYIQRVEVSLDKINAAYLSILQYIGTDPDKNANYNYIGYIPEVLVTLLEEALELMAVKEGLEELCGTNGSHIATLETIAILLNTMGKDYGDEIAANMSTLKSYLGTLGTWINSSKASSMIVDSIWVIPACEEGGKIVADEDALPKAKAGFFKSLWFEIRSFISSFFVNYDQMGLTVIPDENTLNIDVWLATGRDQSQIWRTMIDANSKDGFTYNTGTAVSLKLVTGGTLLPSILSRKGPDVYLGLGAADVINYAIRDAVLGISGNVSEDKMDPKDNAIFANTYYSYRNSDGSVVTGTEKREGVEADFVSNNFATAVDGNFADAAMDTVTLLDVSYGIPQTMSFAMMFYRMDILADLGLEVPETWQELLSILPVLQTNNMSIGVSYIDALDFMIYQSGGSMWKYTDETLYDSKYAGARIDLDSSIALETFNFTCRLYSDYSFPVSYDASNRFRTGEMPIIIGGYSGIYNTLTVYATEIEGLWEFCSLPGSKRADGTFNYDSLANISASVILYGCQGDELLASWQFLQWQTGENAQADYGNRMVALIGPSAKYETANLKAIDDLSWTASEKAAIMNQMDHLSSIVNYPGSYIITRYTQFAFLDAVNKSADPIDAISGYIDAINSEIARKRQEFGLWIPESSEDEPPQLESAE